MRTFYQILGISNNATQEDIIKAYRNKVIENHPDRGGDAIEFMNIRKAYKILSNSNTRKQYDQWLNNKTLESKRQNWLIFIHSFITSICNNNQLVILIESHLKDDDNIYLYDKINSTPTRSIAAWLIKNSLKKIIKDHPQLFKQCIELDSICNDIILNKFTHEKENKKEYTNSYNKAKNKDIPETSGCSLKIIFFIVILFIILSVLLLLNAPSKSDFGDKNTVDIESTSNNYGNEETDFIDSGISHNNKNDLTTSRDNQYYQEIKFNTGDVPYKEYFGKGKFDKESLSELTITNYSSTDAVVILETLEGSVIRNNFIKKESEFTMEQIPNCTCIVKIMFGNSWNPEKDNGVNFPMGGFMEDVSFMESDDKFFFEAIIDKKRIRYPTYSITLHKVKNGNMQTSEISKDDFFKK